MARADPVTEERPSLYERDFCLWLEHQAKLLREGRPTELDVVNLLEELESMGSVSERAFPRTAPYTLVQTLDPQFLPD